VAGKHRVAELAWEAKRRGDRARREALGTEDSREHRSRESESALLLEGDDGAVFRDAGAFNIKAVALIVGNEELVLLERCNAHHLIAVVRGELPCRGERQPEQMLGVEWVNTEPVVFSRPVHADPDRALSLDARPTAAAEEERCAQDGRTRASHLSYTDSHVPWRASR
jgi:hypothetical protein